VDSRNKLDSTILVSGNLGGGSGRRVEGRRVCLAEIVADDFNLNISRYISTAVSETEIDLEATLASIHKLDAAVRATTAAHSACVAELSLPLLPKKQSNAARRYLAA
jgi:hypothetical protein